MISWITRIYTNFAWFLVMSFFEETRKDDVNTNKSFFLSLFGVCIIKKKKDSSLPWVCIVIDHKICLNVLTL